MNSIYAGVLLLALAASTAFSQTTTSMGGYCDTTSFPGQPFVLDGLGQVTSNQCTYGPGSPNVSALLGKLITSNGTLKNLYVKQFQLNSANMGGTATICINPKTGTLPFVTSLSCSLSFSSSNLYTCHNIGNTVNVVAGDRIIAVVTPPGGVSISPVTATVDITTSATTTQPSAGYCGSVSYGTPFVLYNLGQTSNSNCVYGPGTLVQAWLGQVLTKSGTLRNLYVKQEQLNSAPFGGTINVWVNPKTGTSPIQTSIACTLAPNGNLYTCNNTAATYSVQTGDQVIVIVTPPGGNTVSPMAATIDVQ